MLRLTGRVADGWLPSLSYLPEGLDSLPSMSETIDKSAMEAGRAPSEITRLLNPGGQVATEAKGTFNGPPQHWAKQIAELSLNVGISGFFLMSDDPGAIHAFGNEVAPQARALVDAARSARGHRDARRQSADDRSGGRPGTSGRGLAYGFAAAGHEVCGETSQRLAEFCPIIGHARRPRSRAYEVACPPRPLVHPPLTGVGDS